MTNLFDVVEGFKGAAKDAPRSATIEERNAYLRWLAMRDGIAIPADATFGDDGIRVCKELLIAMPGYGDTRRPILEVLDEFGNVVRSTPIAVDTRGRMVMTKAQVQEATDLKPVQARKAKAVAIPQAAPEPVAPVRQGPAVETVTPAAAPSEPDRLAVVLQRMESLERRVATLSRQSDPIGGKAPRSAAHERAVRRAWAERRAARLQRAIAEDHMRMREQHAAAMGIEVRQLQAQLANAHRSVAQWKGEAERAMHREVSAGRQRRRAVINARATLTRLRNRHRHEIERARCSPVYMDGAGREAIDLVGRQAYFARIAMDKAERVSAELSEANARIDRMQREIERIADAYVQENARALRAEARLRSPVSIAA